MDFGPVFIWLGKYTILPTMDNGQCKMAASPNDCTGICTNSILTLDSLPDEILLTILSFLPISDALTLTSLGPGCHLGRLANDPSLLRLVSYFSSDSEYMGLLYLDRKSQYNYLLVLRHWTPLVILSKTSLLNRLLLTRCISTCTEYNKPVKIWTQLVDEVARL